MDVHTDISLKNYLTMKLGGAARFMTVVTTTDELAIACRNAKHQSIPFFILGGGSNVICRDEGFNGIVIRNRIMGFEIVEDTASTTTINVGAGEMWDDIVKKTVSLNLSGIEAMSAIPGTVGASPIQNVGAYGQEIADTLVSINAYDSYNNSFVTINNADCGFSYRHSIFKAEQAGRYAITDVTLKLYKAAPQPPFYAALQSYFDERNMTIYTPQLIRDAVVAIRSDKLPDPSLFPNTGSFFKNAIIEEWQFNELQKQWPDIPSYTLDNKRLKIPSGWLIEQAGFKGLLIHGMRVHDKNALVLINESAGSYHDLAEARNEIIGKVRDMFRITIEQEPLEI